MARTLANILMPFMFAIVLASCGQHEQSPHNDSSSYTIDIPKNVDKKSFEPKIEFTQPPKTSFTHAFDLTTLQANTKSNIPDGCTPILNRTTITLPGDYCLARHIIVDTPNEPGIVIAANDVTIDLLGHAIVSTVEHTTGMGISAHRRRSITIKNGAITGFLSGVLATEGESITLESLDLSGNQWRGARLLGKNIKTINLEVHNMEGHEPYTDSPPIALEVFGNSCQIDGLNYSHIKPIHWSDNTGINAPKCRLSNIYDHGQPDGFCKPIIRPDTLSEPGRYCLKNDLIIKEQNQSGLVITSDDVEIDLAGHAIRSTWPNSLGSGISSHDFDRLSISNGTISGFLFGIRMEECDNCSVMRMAMHDNHMIGIRMYGDAGTVTQSHIGEINGLGGDFASSYSYGIELSGPNAKISENIVEQIYPFREGEGVGISVSLDSRHSHITHNRLNWDGRSTVGRIIGVWLDVTYMDSGNISSNEISNADYAFAGRPGSTMEENTVKANCNYWGGRNIKPDETTNLSLYPEKCNDDLNILKAKLEANPNDAILHFRFGMATLEERNFYDGIKAYEKACSLDFAEACRQVDRLKETGQYDEMMHDATEQTAKD